MQRESKRRSVSPKLRMFQYLASMSGGAGKNSTLPQGLARNRTIEWEWDKIAKGVDQMMKEGKNK